MCTGTIERLQETETHNARACCRLRRLVVTYKDEISFCFDLVCILLLYTEPVVIRICMHGLIAAIV
jgi:hypothetical protein